MEDSQDTPGPAMVTREGMAPVYTVHCGQPCVDYLNSPLDPGSAASMTFSKEMEECYEQFMREVRGNGAHGNGVHGNGADDNGADDAIVLAGIEVEENELEGRILRSPTPTFEDVSFPPPQWLLFAYLSLLPCSAVRRVSSPARRRWARPCRPLRPRAR